jgi:hypothetical protein
MKHSKFIEGKGLNICSSESGVKMAFQTETGIPDE